VMRRAVVTAVSPVARSAVPDRWGEVEIVTNGIDVDSYRVEADRREDLVVFLGRDDPRKGLDVLLRAWPLVQGRHRGAELVVAGATRGSNTDGVRFVGRVSEAEKRRLLGTATVFVAPNTRGESFGIVVAEAMAAGAPVVASDIPAFRWVAGECGVLVPVEDAASVAESVSALLADPERRSGLSAAALRRVGRFDWGTVVALYEAAYRRARDMTM